MIDTKLITFLSLCETKSYTKTAEVLYITQPSVTNHIKQLEKYYGIRLFTSSSKNFSLTKAGKLMYEYANTLLGLDKQFDNAIEGLKKDQSKLRIGATKAIYRGYLTKLLPNMLVKHGEYNIEFIELKGDEIEKELVLGNIDLVIADTHFNKRNYVVKPLFKTQAYLIVSNDSILAGHKKLLFDNILNQRILFDSNDYLKNEFIEKELTVKNRSLKEIKDRVEINNNSLILSLVSKNQGAYLAYDAEVANFLKENEVSKSEIVEIKNQNEINAIYNSNNISATNIENFLQILEKLYKELYKNKYNSSFN